MSYYGNDINWLDSKKLIITLIEMNINQNKNTLGIYQKKN